MALNVSSLSFLSNNTNRHATLNKGASIRGLESFTFMAWFKVGPNSTSTFQSAYVERQNWGNGIRFRFTPVAGKLQFGFSPKDGVADTSYNYNTRWDDRWHHAAFTARVTGDRPSYEIFLDGLSIAKGTLIVPANTKMISDTSPAAITVGNHVRSGSSMSTSSAWEGSIDEVIILKEATSQSAINEYITSKDEWKLQEGLTDPEREPLKHYWKFDENGGTSLSDHRAGLTGSVSTTAVWTKDRPFVGNGLLDTSAPTTPPTPSYTNLTADSFDASWGVSTDNVHVQFYELQVSEYSNFSSYNSYDTGTVRSQKVVNLLPATNYYWRVRAFDANLNASQYTPTVSLTTPILGDTAPPLPPRNVSSSFVGHSDFKLSFTPSSSTDTAGYKLDIGFDPLFDTYLEGYRNRDIGQTTIMDIYGLEALTSYYVRVRAYDHYDNESLPSNILRVNTLRLPDITPPQVVTLREATGIGATQVTLSWEPGIDDVGVAGYQLDLSKNPAFTQLVSTVHYIWQNLDVGNVTSFVARGLDPETDYYFRARAYDEAGNISENTETPVNFKTNPSSIYEAGYVSTEEFPISSASAESVAAVSTATRNPSKYIIDETTNLYLEYDTTDMVGTIQSGIFQFTPSLNDGSGTLGDIQIRVYEGPMDGTVSGRSLEYSITQLDELVEVDVTSFFVSGASLYSIEVSSLGFEGTINVGSAGTDEESMDRGAPVLIVQADPTTSTQPLDQDFEMLNQQRVNLAYNPSFETNTNGWRGIGGASLTITGTASDGLQSCQVTGATTGAGIDNLSASATAPVVIAGEDYSVSFDIRRTSGLYNFVVNLRATDSTGNNPVLVATKNITIDDNYGRYQLQGKIPTGKSRLAVEIKSVAAGNFVFQLDNVLVEQSRHEGSPFNGNTFGGFWRGSANLSVSTMQGARFKVESPFLGDSNRNNSARAFIRNMVDDIGWIETKEPITVDRDLNKYTTFFGPSYGQLNMIKNPSFELDDYLWTGGTRTELNQFTGDWSYSCSNSAKYTEDITVKPNTDYYIQGRIKCDAGLVTIQATTKDRAGSGTLTQRRVTTNEAIYGSNEVWRLVQLKITTKADENRLSVLFNSTMPFFLDAVQVSESSVLTPYRDGSILDGIWEGNPHKSTSGIQINGDHTYVTMFEYTDPEGFFDAETLVQLENRASFPIPAPPDIVTTVGTLGLTSTTDSITIKSKYYGDDNENNSARIEFKRTDLAQWNEVRPTYNRQTKEIVGSITGLRNGSNYTVRVIYTDPDGVYGALMNTVSDQVTTKYPKESYDGNTNISFGGFTLMGGTDRKIGVHYHNAFGFPERRVETMNLPRQDGAVQLQSPWGKKTIRMRGFISGDSRADLADLRTALLRALAPTTEKLVIDTLSHKGRYYYATCSALDIEEDAEENIRHLEWQAEFTCADPFAYDMSETSIPSFMTQTGGRVAINNLGDTIVAPVIEITTQNKSPVTLTVRNTITGDRITPKTTIINQDKLVIDCDKKSLTKNGVEIDYSGGFPRFSIGANDLTFIVSANSGVPVLQTTVRWRHKFL